MVMVFVPPSTRRGRQPGGKPPLPALVAVWIAIAGVFGVALASKEIGRAHV